MIDKNYIAFKCLECGSACVFPSRTSDGRLCPTCKGHIAPTGYAYVGIDLASGLDKTGYPRLKKTAF